MSNDQRICAYRVDEMKKWGLYEAIILNRLRWYFTSFGSAYDGKKFYRTIQQIADDLGLPRDTVKHHLPTEEMGIKHYSGYIPGSITKTSWWEKIEDSSPNSKSTPQAQEYCTAQAQSYNNKLLYKERNKEEKSPDWASAQSSPSLSPFSSDVNKNSQEIPSRDSVDVKPVKRDFAFCQELLDCMGLHSVRVGNKLRSVVNARIKEGYSEVELMSVARWSQTQDEDFYKIPMTLFSEAGVSGALAKMSSHKKSKGMRTI